jgi:hypothetical protein
MATTSIASQSWRVACHQSTISMVAKNIALPPSAPNESSKIMLSCFSPSFTTEFLHLDDKVTTDNIHLFGSISNSSPSLYLHSAVTTKGPELIVTPPSSNSANFVGEINQHTGNLHSASKPKQLCPLEFSPPLLSSTEADFNLLTLIHPSILTILDQSDLSNHHPFAHQLKKPNSTNLKSEFPTAAFPDAPKSCSTPDPQQKRTCPPKPGAQLAQQFLAHKRLAESQVNPITKPSIS